MKSMAPRWATWKLPLHAAHIGWNHLPFEIPDDVYAMWDARAKGEKLENEWNAKFAEYTEKYPAEAARIHAPHVGRTAGRLERTRGCADGRVDAKKKPSPRRKASQNAIEGLAPALPELVGGSADLAGSNLTIWIRLKGCNRENGGNYIYYGVREFGMSAIMNGLSLHGGIHSLRRDFPDVFGLCPQCLAHGGTDEDSFVFLCLHMIRSVLGEDGPTHQPVEQTATLRYIPTWMFGAPAIRSNQLWPGHVQLNARKVPQY